MSDDRSEILGAVVKAQAMVQRLIRDGRNKHGGYNFASIDNFLALVNPICAECGLVVMMNEGLREDFERGGKDGAAPWMRQSYEMIMHHVSGQTLPAVTRTVEVLRNGAQAYGAAQSYALKQYLRGQLLISTGDMEDADYMPPDAGQIVRPSRAGGDDPALSMVIAGFDAAQDIGALKAAWDAAAGWHTHPKVRETKDRRKAALEVKAPAPASTPVSGAPLDDEIPY